MSKTMTVLECHTQITLFKEWGVEVLRLGKQAQASDVFEVFSLGVSLQKEFFQDSSAFGGLVGLYFEALEEAAANVGALLLIPAEQAEALAPEAIPWTIHSSDIYEGVVAWAQTLGVLPVEVWYSFPKPGVPPAEILLLEDGGWNLKASREDLARAGLSPWGGTWEIAGNLLGLFYRDHGLPGPAPAKSASVESAVRKMLVEGASFDDEALALISSGELLAREATFGKFNGWAELDQILDSLIP